MHFIQYVAELLLNAVEQRIKVVAPGRITPRKAATEATKAVLREYSAFMMSAERKREKGKCFKVGVSVSAFFPTQTELK